MCNFHVGQKVTLVGRFGRASIFRAEEDGVVLPVKGQIYTIRDLDRPICPGDYLALRFVEIINAPHWSDDVEPSFEAALFRPVVERKTDISCFKAMLNPSKQPVEA